MCPSCTHAVLSSAAITPRIEFLQALSFDAAVREAFVRRLNASSRFPDAIRPPVLPARSDRLPYNTLEVRSAELTVALISSAPPPQHCASSRFSHRLGERTRPSTHTRPNYSSSPHVPLHLASSSSPHRPHVDPHRQPLRPDAFWIQHSPSLLPLYSKSRFAIRFSSFVSQEHIAKIVCHRL